MVRINTNINSIIANRNFDKIQLNINKSLERLSSGLRVNRSSDDPAGMSIGKKMETQIRGIQKSIENLHYAIGYIQTAEGGLQEITNILQRSRELVIQAANDTNTQQDREKIQIELDQLFENIDIIATTTKYNDITPLQLTPERLKELTEPPVPCDISFVIDTSGSMSPYIMNVADNLTAFVNSLVGKKVHPSISITSTADRSLTPMHPYGDNIDDTKIVLPYTTDIATVVSTLNTIATMVTSAYVDTYNALLEISGIPGTDTAGEYEPDYLPRQGGTVPYFQILLTDTRPEEQVGSLTGYPTPYDSARETATGNALNGADITVFVVTRTMAGYGTYYDYITNTTGGSIYDIQSPTFGNDLLNLADQIATISLAKEGELLIDKRAVKIQTEPNEGGLIELDRPHITRYFLGITGINVGRSTFSSESDTSTYLKKIDKAIESISMIRSIYGASQNRIEAALNRLSVSLENVTASHSRIMDSDFSSEISEFTRNQVLTTAGTYVITNANINSSIALDLLSSNFK